MSPRSIDIDALRPLCALSIGVALCLAPLARAQTFGGLDLREDDAKEEAEAGEQGSDEGGLGLDLSGGESSGQGLSLDLTKESGSRATLDRAVAQFRAEQYEDAALSGYEVMKDLQAAPLHPEAHYVVAKSLYRLGMYHSSLAEFSALLRRGPATPFFKLSLEWLFFIGRKTVNETVVLDEIARYARFEFPERFRNEFRYLLARYHLVRGRALDRAGRSAEANVDFEQVGRIVLMIPRESPFYVRAKYLEGLADYRNQEFRQALEAMQTVVRLSRPIAGDTGEDATDRDELRQLALMQLARIHYAHRQNRKALHYYGLIERGGTQWLDALFEASWASYRIGEYERALGNLITLSSPFFRDEYFPEALILKAVVYYENCRYQESRLIVDDFQQTYLPVHDRLEGLLAQSLQADAYYEVLAEVQRKDREGAEEVDVILEQILNLALTDRDLESTNDSILELERELDSYADRSDAFRYSDLTKRLIEELRMQRKALVAKAGIMAKGKLQLELQRLKGLLANGLRIEFETTGKEREFLEEQLRAGGRRAIVKQYQYSVAVGDDELYWPYEGEYWRDELGTYEYTLTKGCVERPGEAAAAAGMP